jgi:serine/threonine protein kinase
MMLDSCGETSQALLFFSDMSDEFQVGDVIGDYQITGVLGGGGMGKVFRVRNRLSDRAEAMKVVLPGREGDADLTERFLREIKVQASLDHPNIAGLHTALQVGNRILMFMELVDGFSLEQKLRNGPLGAAEAVDCMRQVLAALAFAHSRNVIHRDIKPPNIIVTPDGIAKLTDFGIARSRGDATLTATGTAVGSLYYMPPEQIQGGTADARSDLYSLGVTFYEAVTGQRPFQGENDYAIMQAHFAGAPVAPSERNPAIPRALSALILKAMSRSFARLWQPPQRRCSVRPAPILAFPRHSIPEIWPSWNRDCARRLGQSRGTWLPRRRASAFRWSSCSNVLPSRFPILASEKLFSGFARPKALPTRRFVPEPRCRHPVPRPRPAGRWIPVRSKS